MANDERFCDGTEWLTFLRKVKKRKINLAMLPVVKTTFPF